MISDIKYPVRIIISLSLAMVTFCINNPANVNYGAQHVYEMRDTELNYISSVVEKDDSTLIAMSNTNIFRIDKRGNVPEVKVFHNEKPQWISGLYKDRAGRILFNDNYYLCRINFFDDTCNFDTILENVTSKICQDNSGNIWLLNLGYDYDAFLYRWDGQSVKMKRQTGAIYNSVKDYCIASDTEEICMVAQTSHSVLISRYRISDFSLSSTDSLNMNYDSSKIINAFIIGGKLNLLLNIQGSHLIPGEKDVYYWQSVIATVEQDRVLFRECFDYPEYWDWDSSPVLKTGPDECWVASEGSVYRITPDDVRSINVPQDNGLYINSTGEVMMFYSPTLKSILLRDVM